MGVAVGISLLSCIEAEIYAIVYLLPVMATVCALRLTPTLRTIVRSPIVFPDPKNVGVAVGISLLCCTEAEILRFPTYFRFMAAILISGWDTVIISTSLKSH